MNDLLIHNVEEKLGKEAAEISDRYSKVMEAAVRAALVSFCKQESEFAQAI